MDEALASPFYPSTKSAVFTTLWVNFDPRSLLSCMQTNSFEDIVTIRNRIGDLPMQLLKNLSLKPRDPPSHCQEDSASPSDSSSTIKSWVQTVANTSYTLHLLSSHFKNRKSTLPPSLVFFFALQLILLLLLTVVFHLPAFSPSRPHLCRIYGRSLSQLTQLSQSLRSMNLSAFHGSCLSMNPLLRDSRICCAVEGPIQQSLRDVLNSFLAVSLEALRDGCIFEVIASSTDYFALELNRLLIWLASSEPAGWKINRNLSLLMSRFFISHVAAWRAYVHLLINISSNGFHWMYNFFVATLHVEYFHLLILPLTISFLQVYWNRWNWRNHLIDLLSSSSRVAIAIIICFSLDLLVLATLHLSCFYVYTVRLFRVQLLAVAASWRLCRSGSKWNPLRGRVDTIPQNDDMPPVVASAILVPPGMECDTNEEELPIPPPSGYSKHLDRLFVATFLGVATGLCLLPTTIAFYATFSGVSFS